MHIIFNSEYKNTSDQVFIESLPKAIKNNCVEITRVKEFDTLIKNLSGSTTIKIWVHLGALETQNHNLPGMVVEYNKNATEFLNEKDIKFKQITRGSERAISDSIVFTNHMTSSINKEYTVYELQQILNPDAIQVEENIRRPRLIESYKKEISNFNEKFLNFENFISDYNGEWYKALPYTSEVFDSKYWYFDLKTFLQYIKTTGEKIIDDENIDVESGIEYDYDNKLWRIDYNFFDQVSSRLENNEGDYKKNLQLATKLFLLHEAIHKYHKLDKYTVVGIGNFPRIVEWVDYQADAVAMLLELSFQLKQNNNSNSNTVINTFQNIIRIAIETTFSFNPISDSLIQIRRVNRYNIWLFIYIKLDKLRKEELSIEEAYKKIYEIIYYKPLIEISGPNIISKDHRTFFEIENITSIKEYAYINSMNQLIRGGETSKFNLDKILDGFNNSSFDDLYEELKKVID